MGFYVKTIEQWDKMIESDKIKNKVLEEAGVTVLRIPYNHKLKSAEDLKTLITQGEFREDLYFRIEGFNIELSPLRERTGDIPFLLEHFLKELNTYGRKVILDNEVKSLLQSYSWPGNIRELQKTVQLFLANSKGIVTVEMLPDKRNHNNQSEESINNRRDSSQQINDRF